MPRIQRTIIKMVILWLGLSMIPFGYYFHIRDESHRFLITQLKDQNQQVLTYVETDAALLNQSLQQIFQQLSRSPLLLDYVIKKDPHLRKRNCSLPESDPGFRSV